MKRQKDIDALLSKANLELKEIKTSHTQALKNREVDLALSISTNDFIHHNKQVLDFLAHEIVECYGGRIHNRIFFPIARRDHTPTSFQRDLNSWFSGLRTSKPVVFRFLMDIQPFVSVSNAWLYDFQDVANANKHVRLVPHEFNANLTLGGIWTLQGGASLTLEEGATFLLSTPLGDLVIRGPQTFTGLTRPGVVLEQGFPAHSVEWFDFKLGHAKIPVLDLLDRIQSFVSGVYSQLDKLL